MILFYQRGETAAHILHFLICSVLLAHPYKHSALLFSIELTSIYHTKYLLLS